MKKTAFLTALTISTFVTGAAMAQSQDFRTVRETPNTVYTYRGQDIKTGAYDRMGNPMPQVQGGLLGERSTSVQTNDGVEAVTGNALSYDGIVEPGLEADAGMEASYGNTASHTTSETVTLRNEDGSPVTSRSVTTTTQTAPVVTSDGPVGTIITHETFE